jgi:glycosyltransferase involved in cell wall biosynthesis
LSPEEGTPTVPVEDRMSSSHLSQVSRTAEPIVHAAVEPEFTLFVACYNEAPNILVTLDTIVAALRRLDCAYEIIVIDDASTDESVRLLEGYLRAHPELPLRLRVNRHNRGLARNFVEAAVLGRGTYFKLVCGDNVESEETLVNILSRRGRSDLILPYHLTCPGKSPLRMFLSRLFTRLVNTLSGHRVRYYNGLPLFRRQHVLRFQSPTSSFGYQADLVVNLLNEGVRYEEVEVQVREREQGTSHALSLRNFLLVGNTLVLIGWRRLRRQLIRATSRR